MPADLTPRQAELVALIDRLTTSRGFPPTLRECAAALRVTHPRVDTIARGLERRGVLTHEPRVARSWRLKPAGKPARRRRPARRGAMVEA
jgi:Mn-dependent DtxR family transcriptional regulator